MTDDKKSSDIKHEEKSAAIDSSRKNRSVVLSLLLLIAGMLLLVVASSTLYNVFCRVTGFSGVVKESAVASMKTGKRKIIVHFDANVNPELPWRFVPKQQKMTVMTGQNSIAFYEAENMSDQNIIGTAVYNVSPHEAAKYFNKIQCFCFSEQMLKSHETMSMPVSFFIDSEFDNDPEVKDVHEITLSYTFFKIK